jgi:uncharacterized damage-inducible protein DinB
MDLLDRLLGHDVWTTQQLLDICADLPKESLDREFDIGHRTLRRTLDHIISNMETWSCLMAGMECVHHHDQSLEGLRQRAVTAAETLQRVARKIADEEDWDAVWTDHLDDPPQQKSFGSAIAHIITHSMHHRAQVLYMLRLCGVESLPEGDVFSWENAAKGST